MTMPDDALNRIAAELLNLETLDTRNSARLDFHELAVWQIRKALEAAYHAGFTAGSSPSAASPDRHKGLRRRGQQ